MMKLFICIFLVLHYVIITKTHAFSSSRMMLVMKRDRLGSPFISSSLNIHAIGPLVVSSQKTYQSLALNAVIPAATDEDFISIDDGLGGVRLAMESAIKVNGEYKQPTSNDKEGKMKVSELIRYFKVTPVEESDILKNKDIRIICKGYGKECYYDPGQTTLFRIELAPMEAAKDAIKSLSDNQQQQQPIDENKVVVINVLGGDDLMVHEATDAVKEIVAALQIPNKCKIKMHSLCHPSFPVEYASITVLEIASSTKDKRKKDADEVTTNVVGIAKSISCGDIYNYQGKWWTVADEDINTATEIYES